MLKKERREFLLKLFVITIAFVLFLSLGKTFIGFVVYDNNFLSVSFENNTVTEYELPYEVFMENLEFTPENIDIKYIDNNSNGLIDHFKVNRDDDFNLRILFDEDEKIDVILKLNVTEQELIQKYNLKEKNGIITLEIAQGDLHKLTNKIEKVSLNRKFNINLQDAVPIMNINDSHFNNITGTNQTVCILDTGIYNHSDIYERVVNEKCYCKGCCINGASESDDAYDDNGHGTMVSGIVGAYGNITGTAINANYVEVKVCSSRGGCYASDIMKGINYCANNKEKYNISVITMSIGSGSTFDDSETCSNLDAIFTEVVNNAYSKGLSIVSSSGNSGVRNGISYPACLGNVTGVGAVDDDDNIAGYSNIGSLLDLLAQGTRINTTTCMGSGSLCSSSGYIDIYSGTSFSAPFVSGSILLLREYTEKENVSLSAKDIENILINTGKKIQYEDKNYTRINVLAALNNISSLNKTTETEEDEIVLFWNSLNENLPYGRNILRYNNVTFYANFTNITNDTCIINIENYTYNLTYDINKTLFYYEKEFEEFKNYTITASCENQTLNTILRKDEFNFYLNRSIKIYVNDYENDTIEGLSLRIFEFNTTNASYETILNGNSTEEISITEFLIIKGEKENKTPHKIIINNSDYTLTNNIIINKDMINKTEKNTFYINITNEGTTNPPHSQSSSGGSSGGGGGSSGGSSTTETNEETKETGRILENKKEDEGRIIGEEEFSIHEEPETRILEKKPKDDLKMHYIIIAPLLFILILTVYIEIVKNKPKKKLIKKNKLKTKKR